MLTLECWLILNPFLVSAFFKIKKSNLGPDQGPKLFVKVINSVKIVTYVKGDNNLKIGNIYRILHSSFFNEFKQYYPRPNPYTQVIAITYL